MLGPSQHKHERAVSIFVLTEAAAAAGLVPAALQPVLADAADVATATAIRSHILRRLPAVLTDVPLSPHSLHL